MCKLIYFYIYKDIGTQIQIINVLYTDSRLIILNGKILRILYLLVNSGIFYHFSLEAICSIWGGGFIDAY